MFYFPESARFSPLPVRAVSDDSTTDSSAQIQELVDDLKAKVCSNTCHFSGTAILCELVAARGGHSIVKLKTMCNGNLLPLYYMP